MNKKLITAILATITLVTTAIQAVPAKADNAPAVAILDTALDTSLPIFKDRIAYEVCILEWNSCPNGKSFQEGPGSAVLPMSIITNNGFSHGTTMASVVANTDPNVKIVFIRIIGNTPSGGRQIANELTVVNALNWVLQNKDKFNIKAVSMSQGNHGILTSNTNYCPNTQSTKDMIDLLLAADIPTFLAAGNGRDYERIDWPACIDSSISIGMADQYDQIDNYSNYDSKKLDFYAVGNMQVTSVGGVQKYGAGTSASTQVAATTYAAVKNKNPNLNSQQILDILSQTSVQIKGSRGQTGKLIKYQGAINVR